MEKLIALFKHHTGKSNPRVEQLPISGSNRKYYRLIEDNISLIGVHGESIDENRAFISIAQHFKNKGLNTPEVYSVSDDEIFYLQEDLGDVVLFEELKNGRLTGVFSSKEKELLHKAISLLPDLQIKGGSGFDYDICYPQPEFNYRSVFWDLNYFKYNFLKTTGMDFQEDLLEDDFEKLADDLLEGDNDSFLYRDFQSRNVMIKDEELYFIDFQGGRKGPIYYDVASFLWQAKANFPNNLRSELIDTYIKSLQKYRDVDYSQFISKLRIFVLFRTLQVLGAYGFRGYFEKKQSFIDSIPFALNNLRELLEGGFDRYQYLNEVLNKMVNLEQFLDKDKPELTVRVFSFSYRKGIPNDVSENGGGYVFDCRSIHNPGRYEEYKTQTGLDEDVKIFLEKDGEMKKYLDNIYPLVDTHIERYIERGFTDLMVSFGCTGGQHRSVYAAQNMAEHISNKFGIRVSLVHREQNIEQEFT